MYENCQIAKCVKIEMPECQSWLGVDRYSEWIKYGHPYHFCVDLSSAYREFQYGTSMGLSFP